MSKYLIVQSRWLRGSTQSGENVIDEAGRKREARGLVRHHFLSSLNVIQKHFKNSNNDIEEIQPPQTKFNERETSNIEVNFWTFNLRILN